MHEFLLNPHYIEIKTFFPVLKFHVIYLFPKKSYRSLKFTIARKGIKKVEKFLYVLSKKEDAILFIVARVGCLTVFLSPKSHNFCSKLYKDICLYL